MARKAGTLTAAEHRHTPAEERKIREAALDETIANTFPASDPPSSIPNPDEHDAVADLEKPESDTRSSD
ncbi:MAG: hypothetical protein ACRD09_15505 [Vicinamibacterales bacterium]